MKTSAVRVPHAHRVSAAQVLYPESDGRPMGETDVHRRLMNYLVEALRLWFRRRSNVYVSGNLMMYYVEGDTNISVSPDVFVVKGVPAGDRRVYKLWEERKAPCVVIELSSRRTKSEDLTSKFELYRDVMKVAEYYVYDPLREYLPGRLRAWNLRSGRYVERHFMAGRVHSRELGLDLLDFQGNLLLVDPTTGRTLPGLEESEGARAELEAARSQLESALAKSEAALAKSEAARVVDQIARLNAEAARIDTEAQLRKADEENRKLRESLEKLRRKQGS